MMPSSDVIAGFALDLTTTDVDGRAWNFDEKEMRDRARKKFHAEEPMFLIGSPSCQHYSLLQALSAARRDPEEVRRELVKAQVHMEFVTELSGSKCWQGEASGVISASTARMVERRVP